MIRLNPTRAARRKVVIYAFCHASSLLALLLLSPPSNAQTAWNAATGSWFDPTNWSSGVPTSSINATINNSGISQVAITGALARDLMVGDTAGGAVEIAGGGTLSNRVATIGNAATSNATVSVIGAGSVWASSSTLTIGQSGRGELTVADGAQVTNLTGRLGFNATGIGLATVTGTDSAWTISGSLTIGDDGEAELTITDGASVSNTSGTIANSAGSLAAVSVTGTGSVWDNSFLTVGDQGDGELTISGGATVTSTSSDVGSFDGNGYVTVTGAGSQWQNSSRMTLGVLGTGSLTISNGGTVSADSTEIGSSSDGVGTLDISDATSSWASTGSLTVGYSGTGTLSVTGGIASVAQDTFVARSSMSAGYVHLASGTLTTGGLVTRLSDLYGTGAINTNGLVTDIDLVFDQDHGLQQQFIIANQPGQNIEINLDAGAAGSMGAGYGGQGSLTIADGRVIESRDGYLGYHTNAVGTASISGLDSAWRMTGSLTVGYSGAATLTIADGAAVEVDQTTYVGRSGGIASIHFDNGTLETTTLWASPDQILGAGSVTTHGLVSDVDLQFDDDHGLQQMIVLDDAPGQNVVVDLDLNGAGALGVGYRGDASLAIADGVNVASTGGYLGYRSGSHGTATVSGTDTAWTISGELSVGSTGRGDLTIADGAVVTNAAGTINNGKVTVTGAHSSWTNSAGLSVGGFYFGTSAELLIANGGQVYSAGPVSPIFPSGIASQNGSVGNVTVTDQGSAWTHGGSLTVGGDGTGTLTIAAGGRVSTSGGIIGGSFSGFSGSGAVVVQNPGSAWTNTSSLIVGNRRPGSLTIGDGGTVTSTSGTIAASFGATGTVNIAGNGASWAISGPLTVGSFSSSANATVTVGPGGYLAVAGETLIHSASRLRLEGGEVSSASIRFQFTGGQFNWTAGTLHVGTYHGNLTNSAGTLAPGNSAGSTAILGSYTQQGAATLQIEIGGPLPTTQHDFVSVTNTVALGGTLQLAMLGGYVPNPADTFAVLDATGNVTGTFANVANGGRLATADGSGSFLVNYGAASAFNPKQIVLSNFELSGDFNQDSAVDAADYVAWRKMITGNPAIDEPNYASWQRNFGLAVGADVSGGPNSTTVPEAATLKLLTACLGAIILLARPRRYGAFHSCRTCPL
jgi:T5SS/PEP-CTERM-associated repeat protein